MVAWQSRKAKPNWRRVVPLTTKAVEGAALAFEGVDDVHGSDCLPLGVFGVGDGVTDDVLKEHLQDTTGLFVDQARDTLDSTTTGQTTDSRLGDTLDVITKYLAMTLSASLSESLASLSTSSHVGGVRDELRPATNFPPYLGAVRTYKHCTRLQADPAHSQSTLTNHSQ